MSKVMREVIRGHSGVQQKSQPSVTTPFSPPLRRATNQTRRSDTDDSPGTSLSSGEALPSIWTGTQTAFISAVLNVRTLLSPKRQILSEESSTSATDLESQVLKITEAGNRTSGETIPHVPSAEIPVSKQQENATKSPKAEASPPPLPVDDIQQAKDPILAQNLKSEEMREKVEDRVDSPAETLPDDSQSKKLNTDNVEEDNQSNKNSASAESLDQDSNHNQLPSANRPPPVQSTPQQAKLPNITPPNRNLHEYLVRGYYKPGTTIYQPRRTLDQYIYADIEATSHRDDDQVVYRYTNSETLFGAKMFMVDQLWIWILGKGS